MPSHVAGSGTLDRLVDTARDYARAAASENTLKAYAKDWTHFARWCRMKGAEPLPPSPEMIGLYLADLASGSGPSPALSVSTIDRRLSGLAWNYAQRGFTLDRKNRHIATVLAGIKRKHGRPPVQKEAILAEGILAMVATLPYDLRGLRDRAILLLGYAGGLRRSEVVCLDVHKDDTPDSGGWIEFFDGGALLTLNAKTGWREVEIGRGSSDQTCPVHALEQWLHFAKIDCGPVFVRTSRDGKRALETRLSDKHVARLIKATVLKSGVRSDLPEAKRLAMFYLTFDNVEVGRMQARAVFKVQPKGNYAFIKGASTDPNADFLHGGQLEVLQAAIDKGDIKVVGEQYTDGWKPENAQRNMEQILTANNNKVDAVVASNDGTAGGVVAALTAQGMEGIPVSGQDGDHAALNRVARGWQTVSVWKDARELGKAAGSAAIQLAKGQPVSGAIMWSGGAKGVKMDAILLPPVPITRDNLDVVISAGWVSKDVVCQGVTKNPPAACK